MHKILVLSDTHGKLPINIDSFHADFLIHAGDIGGEILNKIDIDLDCTPYIVRGNTDFDINNGVPDFITKTIEGVRFFIVHNLSAPHRIISENNNLIKTYQPDVVIFGHTHKPLIEKKRNILFFNPGSVGMAGMTGERSYGIINVDKGFIMSAETFRLSGQVIDSWLKK